MTKKKAKTGDARSAGTSSTKRALERGGCEPGQRCGKSKREKERKPRGTLNGVMIVLLKRGEETG